jgi:hypothetical protein
MLLSGPHIRVTIKNGPPLGVGRQFLPVPGFLRLRDDNTTIFIEY